MRSIMTVTVRSGYCLEVVFDDGVHGVVDLSDLVGKGVFAIWHDRRTFEQVEIGSSGELMWGGKVDLCPDSLYLRVTGKEAEAVFPSLQRESAHA